MENLPISNIMVIDDTPANLALLEEMLENYVAEIRLFSDGVFAIESAKYSPPNLILLDIMMPTIDGYEVCKRLKSIDRLKEIPVIFLSAKTETFDKVQAFNAGGVDYITKPFQIDEVLARIKTHYNLFKYKTELESKNNELNSALQLLQKTQLQLVQSRTMTSLGTLTAGIAHEINNPVNAINASGIALKKIFTKLQTLAVLYDQITLDNVNTQLKEIQSYKEEIDIFELLKGIRDLLENIEKGSKRTIDIIQSLKTFTHKDLTQKEFINIHDNIDSTLTLLNHRIKEKVNVLKDYGEVPQIKCFPGKINQVFMNLFSNAIDAMVGNRTNKDDNTITISTSTESINSKDYLIITIADNGCGIPDDIIDRIYEPFFTTKEVGKGTGLGLSISLGIIENHSGLIDVSSKVGIGTRFIIKLPIEKEN